jgi:hypothetical protein
MKIYNRYILTVAVLLMATTIILIATGQKALDIYYTIYVIEALVITELFLHFNSRVRRSLNMVSTVLFGGFVIALCVQAIKLIA